MHDTVMGYRRAHGRFGIRNQVLVISLVQCANGAATQIAAHCGVPAITINTGCGEYHDQENRTNLGLIRAGQHPNVYGAVLISLGCQWTNPQAIAAEIGINIKTVNRAVRRLSDENLLEIVHGKIRISRERVEQMNRYIGSDHKADAF